MRWFVCAFPLLLSACFSESDVPRDTVAEEGSTHGETGCPVGTLGCPCDAVSCNDGSPCSSAGFCGEPTTGTSTTAGSSTGTSSSDDAGIDAESSLDHSSGDSTAVGTMLPETGTTAGLVCPDGECIDCVLCAFQGPCSEVHEACKADTMLCAPVLACQQACSTRDEADIPGCVADCGCGGAELQAALADCVVDICDGSCVQPLPCGSDGP